MECLSKYGHTESREEPANSLAMHGPSSKKSISHSLPPLCMLLMGLDRPEVSEGQGTQRPEDLLSWED